MIVNQLFGYYNRFTRKGEERCCGNVTVLVLQDQSESSSNAVRSGFIGAGACNPSMKERQMSVNVSYDGFPIPEEYKPWESSVGFLNDGSILIAFSNRDTSVILGVTSKDGGKTWESPVPLRTQGGKKIKAAGRRCFG